MELVLVALAGFVASLVDGALGMGFGPTSSSILLSTGLGPAAVSATVNIAKVVTGLAAAISHWRFNNIDHRLVLELAIPGCVGAVIGVTVLANVDGDVIRPVLNALLLLVGARILLRFSRPLPLAPDPSQEATTTAAGAPRFDERGTIVVAATGGVTNGLVGAWGPVVTPYLLHKGLAPRFAVGSVNTAEVAVATIAAGSIIASFGSGGLDVAVVLAMLAGGVLAAPLAAYAIRFLPARALGLAVAALLLLTNVRDLADQLDLGAYQWLAYAVVVVLVTIAALRPRLAGSSVEAAPSAER